MTGRSKGRQSRALWISGGKVSSSVQGKAIIVTGAGRGIGAAIARERVGVTTFLASTGSDCITDQTFMVDGGMVLI